ncbi:MAG: cyclase family protein [Pseudomonadota bacterium]|nr:cyclase family protein [Pseudomonadota bacterium]QKK04631.1 MAG: cyclase family protein [Pseudomonadota bacterium]
MAMELAVTIGKNSYRIDPAEGMDISIPVRFDENGLTAFGAEKASSTAYQAEGFTGAVEKGGSCNCGLYHFSPHLHGTHTECVGHLSKNALHITDRLPQAFVTATLITVTPETEEGDRVITKQSLESALKEAAYDFMDALVIRTLPNDAEKKSRDYDGKEMPPYFTGEAMAFIVLAGVRHLLVDLPSIDRMDDGGALANHRMFWNVPEGAGEISEGMASDNTVTELIYVPEAIKDGKYLLNLQVAAFAADAAPSRPVLYEVMT